MDKDISTQKRMEEFGEQCRCLTKERHSVSHQSRHFTEYTEEEGEDQEEVKGERKNKKNEGKGDGKKWWEMEKSIRGQH